MAAINKTFNANMPAEATELLAATYMRMSTEHQKYSVENQTAAINEYAAIHGIRIVKEYVDEGKTGVTLAGRKGLQNLLKDVQAGNAGFHIILVLDVTRWGRFQDADENAHYEFLCRRAGVAVEYVAEQFTNDGSVGSNILKNVKRVMAGETSRELSKKVKRGQCNLIVHGFRQGGPAGYGLRRMMVDEHGTPKGIIDRGNYKSYQTDRVILVPGPEEEIENVRLIYSWFVEEKMTELEIARLLNLRGIMTDYDREWTRSTVQQILTNEKYIGNNVYNRRSFILKVKRTVNPPSAWIRKDGAFQGIIDVGLFLAAQTLIQERSRKYSNDEMLEKLKALYEREGFLSGLIINEADDMPSSIVYSQRFGSLIRAYQLIGYTPDRDYRFIEVNRALRHAHAQIVEDTIRKIRDLGTTVRWEIGADLFTVHDELKVSMVICRCTTASNGMHRWKIRLDSGLRPDLTIAIRMDAANEQPLDYYLLPALDIENPQIRLSESNGVALDAFRFDDLEPFFYMTEREPIRSVA